MFIRNDVLEQRAKLSPAKRMLLEKRLSGRFTADSKEQIIPRHPRDGLLPPSFGQERLWFLDQLEPNSAAYNRPVAVRLRGLVNREALEQSLHEILERHEALRTTLSIVKGQLTQIVSPPVPLSLPAVDLSRLPKSERETQTLRLVNEEAGRPFDLAKGPLVRMTLLRMSEDDHILILVMHHAVFDGWSQGVLYREMGSLYEAFSAGKPSALPELAIQYADFAVWQRNHLRGEALEEQLAYWREKLGSRLAVLQLPTDRPRPAIQTYMGRRHWLVLPESLTQALKALSRREEVTLFMTLLSAFEILLYRYSGEEDILVGSPIAGRIRRETEALIGFFVNTLVIRADLSGNPSFRQLLGRVRTVAVEAYAHQDLPFEKLVEVLQPERDLSRTPLFQVMFQLRNIPGRELKLSGLEVCDFEFDSGIAKLDLSLDIREKTEELSCLFEYNSDLFDAATIGHMAEHFHALLNSIVTDPDQPVSALSLLTDAERRQLLVEWNNTSIDYPRDLCIHQLFEAQVEKTPDATAVTFGTESLTYSQLNARSNQLARYLRRRGAEPDNLVGICVERSLEMVVGLLGILKAGAAYVPLDPEYPRARLAYMLEDTSVCLLLTQERLLERLPKPAGEMLCLDRDRNLFEGEAESNLEEITQPEHLAYAFYTSGSTGKPKGVLIAHRGVVNYFAYLVNAYNLSSADVVLQIASPSFDPSVRDIIGPLTIGAQVVVVTDTRAKEPAALLCKIKEHRVSCLLSVVPTMLNELIEAASDKDLPYDSLRLILVSGEALQLSACRKARTVFGQALVVNQYGPTECTMTSTYYPILTPEYGRDIAQIGRPIPNSQTYVLDSDLNLVPVGVRGELHIGGVGLARGYLNRPDLTAEKFIPNPFRQEPGARLYKTGDLARYLPDGNIEFLGRKDYQVKIRGFRVELGEIEAALLEHDGVHEAVVIAREEVAGEKRLVAYIVSEQEHPPALDKLRGFLNERLPEYMVPSAFVALDELPLTLNGKVDRRALRAPDQTRSELLSDFKAPRGVLEVQLTRIWEKLLNVWPVGVSDNFFELGGHSLLAVRLFLEVEKLSGKKLPVTTIFQSPTVEELASVIDHETGTAASSSLVSIHPNGTKPPFFFVHGVGGTVLGYRHLVRHMDPDQPVYGLQAQGLDGIQAPSTRIEEMAAHYLKEIRTLQPKGPYYLGGHSFGAKITFEMGYQLHAQGEKVGLLALFDPSGVGLSRSLSKVTSYRLQINSYIQRINFHLSTLLLGPQRLNHIRKESKTIKRKIKSKTWQIIFRFYRRVNYPLPRVLRVVSEANRQASRDYVPKVYPGRLTVFLASEPPVGEVIDRRLAWGQMGAQGVDIQETHGDHLTFLEEPNVRVLAEKLSTCLDKAQAHESGEIQ